MTIQEAKEIVVLAGKRLVESGLIARTWGNVSCRISDSHFVITPSGREYLTLTPEEIVEVSISDCSYTGDIKPSSEKGVHAEVYKLHPEVNFVIHTHQDHASSVSVLDLDSIKVSKDFTSLQGEVVCADYGLPGTKTLRKGVAAALAKSKGNAIIMKNHGALCFGINYDKAFLVAQELEDACEQFVINQYRKIADPTAKGHLKIGTFALTKLTGKTLPLPIKNVLLPCESERINDGFRLTIGEKTYHLTFNQLSSIPKDLPSVLAEAKIHNQIYLHHENIHHILHTDTSGITSVSYAGIKLLPLLDDFAQIAGTTVKSCDMNPEQVSKSLGSSSAVFLKNNGVLCCAGSKEDAQAVGMVVEKNSNALISAALFGKIKYIKHFECMLMRFVYLKKYSKQAYKK